MSTWLSELDTNWWSPFVSRAPPSLPDFVWRVFLSIGTPCLINDLGQSSLQMLHYSTHESCSSFHPHNNQVLCQDHSAFSTCTPKSSYISYPWNNSVELSHRRALQNSFCHTHSHLNPACPLLLPLSLLAGGQRYQRKGKTYNTENESECWTG